MNDDIDKYKIDKTVLDEINTEFQNFTINKLNHIKTIKDYNTKLLNQVDNLKFPSLEGILSKNYSISLSSKQEVCEYCGYIAKNQKALTAHLRGCKKQHTET